MSTTTRTTCRFVAALGVLTFALPLAVRADSIIKESFSGLQYTLRTQTVPRPLRIHILEIDPTKAGVQFRATPSNGSAAGENTPQTTRAYVGAARAQAGINASFFFVSGTSSPNFDNRGIVASQGSAYSPFGENADYSRPWPALNISSANVAQIVDRISPYTDGYGITPAISLYNAVSGSERIVTNGVNTAGAVGYGEPTVLHPRTVMGITATGKIVMLVVDGRQSGFSEGMTSIETANLLIQYGVVNAVNFDGGGSSSFVFADPVPRELNSPSDGNARNVSVSWAVFANQATFAQDIAVFSDFYAGDKGTFAYAPTASGSTQGVLATSTNTTVQSSSAYSRGWFQRLTIRDDPAVSTVSENPTGGWFVRHLSGATGAPADNLSRPTLGYVGFWARTSTAGISAAIAVDAPSTADRGIKRALTADGQWHLYQWNLADPAQWQSWGGSDGLITGSAFTVDSIQLFGPNADAVVELDQIMHNTYGTLDATQGPALSKLNVPAASVTASDFYPGSPPSYTVDGAISSTQYWASQGDGKWIQYDLGSAKRVAYLKIAWIQGNARVETFDVQVSSNGTTWTNKLTGAKSSGYTTALEAYNFADVTARYVRIVGHGNTANTWNSIAETEIWGF
ncbi:MAG: phosphodiester glycosidase family protein [Opitutae bacterium]|nr:phosphodiester glycosidase family protein [Opitutae bacterium]